MIYIIGFISFVSTYLSILFCFHKWRREGLILWSVLAVIIANMQVVKIIEIFGSTTTLGNIMYVSSFFVANALCEFYGKKEAEKVIFISIFIRFICIFFDFLTILTPTISTQIHIQETISTVFNVTYRFTLCSIIAYYISQKIDIHIYEKMTQKDYSLWQKNIWSIFVSQLIDSILFALIGIVIIYYQSFSIENNLSQVFTIAITSYFIKMIINISHVPFLYLLRKMRNSYLEGV